MAVSSLKGKKKMESDESEDDEFSNEEEEEEEDSSFNEDMLALKRALMLTGQNPNQFNATATTNTNTTTTTTTVSVLDSDSEGNSEIDDVELVRQIQQRFNLSSSKDSNTEAVYLKPLNSLPPVGALTDDDSEDDDNVDFETLRAIEKRFGTYGSSVLEKNSKCISKEPVVPQGTKTSYSLPVKRREDNASLGQEFQYSKEAVPASEEAYNSSLPLLSFDDKGPCDQPLGSNDWNQPEASRSDQPEAPESPISSTKYSRFPHPKSAYIFIDAIKKNRAFQKLIRNKLIQIEARIEENRKLKERIKLLKDFQLSCKRRAGRALSQKKDARIQLISTCKPRKTTTLKVNDKKVHALCFGPVENSHVANYRMVMQRYPPSRRERWSHADRENLGKGIKQQFQEMLLQRSFELYSDSNISSGDSDTFNDMVTSISEFDIPPEKIKSFLPKVDWERLASLYVEGRSGAECEARWRNHEDPLINRNPWTNDEDKKLLFIIEKRQSIQKWLDISSSLGTNRTPFQCLARYQRSLNSKILKREWTEDDDAQLRAAVAAFGENDWPLVASNMEGRTGTQCSNRWTKTLNPVRKREGRWTVEEDKHLKVAVMLFGAKTWNEIEQFVPGRTQVQCRERWLNVLDPSMNLGRWTEEEDSSLKAAILEHGYCWSKVAEAVPNRTDNQCRRRWKVLLPHEVPVLQEARRIQKVAIISNFVGREEERPALGPSDFLPFPGTCALTEGENGNNIRRKKKKQRGRIVSKKPKDIASQGDAVPRKKTALLRRSKRLSNQESRSYAQISSTESSDVDEDVNVCEESTSTKKKNKFKSCPRRKKFSESEQCGQEFSSSIGSSTVLRIDTTYAGENNTSEKKGDGKACTAKKKSDGVDKSVNAKNTISKKKKERKARGKREKYTEPLPTEKEIPLSPEPSSLMVTTGYACHETYGKGDSTSQNKKTSENWCTEPVQDLQDLPLYYDSSDRPNITNCGVALNSSYSGQALECQDGTNELSIAFISQSKEVPEAIVDDENVPISLWSKKVKRRKPRPTNKNGQCGMPCVEKSKLIPELPSERENSFTQVEVPEQSELDGPRNSHARCSDCETLTASIIQQDISIKSTTGGVYHCEEIPGAMDEDHVPLASFMNEKVNGRLRPCSYSSKGIPEAVSGDVPIPIFPNKKKKRKRGLRLGLSDEVILELMDKEDVPLGFFLNKRAKKTQAQEHECSRRQEMVSDGREKENQLEFSRVFNDG